MARKLASIQCIHHIWPIEGADRIECVGVLGWQCVAKKGEFAVGDHCVYFEIDSFLPADERFSFLGPQHLRHSDLLGDGYRLRTQTFRGQISQGLALPVAAFGLKDQDIGTDVTELLGVKKWEVEIRASSSGTIIGTLPAFVPKTDETRVQAMPALIDAFAGLPYYITTKMDGTSVTMYRERGRFGVCGHNFELKDDEHCSFWTWAHEMEVEKRLKEAGLDDIVIQGEFCAPGIQRNPLALRRPAWYVFTILDAKTQRRYGLEEMRQTIEDAGLTMVPVEEVGDDLPYKSVAALLERARGTYECGKTKEGIVVRPQVPVYSPLIGANLSMKVVNNDYLTKRR